MNTKMILNMNRLKNILVFFTLLVLFLLFSSSIFAQQHGDLIRAQGDTKIYLIQNGQRRVIVNEDVFRQMGFKMEDVKELDTQTVMSLPEGPPLWSKEYIAPYPDGTLIRLKGKVQTYVIRGGRKCYIPDPETFQAQGFQWDQVLEVDPTTFNKIPTGIPLASVKPPYQYGSPGITAPMGPPGSPPGTYPPATYPPGAYPPATYPPGSYPPSGSPPPYPYPPPPGSPGPSSPPPSGQPAPSYPPSTAPPSYPSPTYPPTQPPAQPPSQNPSPSSFVPSDHSFHSLFNPFFVESSYQEYRLRFLGLNSSPSRIFPNKKNDLILAKVRIQLNEIVYIFS